MSKIKGAGALLGGAFVVSTFGIWTRLMEPMFSTAAQVVARCLLAAVIMVGVIFYLNNGSRYRGYTRRQYIYMSLLGIMSFALAILLTISVAHTKVGNTFALIYGGSIITSFCVGTFVLKENISLPKVLAIIIALIGLALYAQGFSALNYGIIAGFGAGICDGLSNFFRKQLREVNRNVTVMYQYLLAGLLAIPLLFISPEPNIQPGDIWPIVALVCFALASLAFGKLLLHGFSHFDVNIGGVLLAMQIFFALILGFLFFHEIPTTLEMAGGVLIFIAVILTLGRFDRIVALLLKRQIAR